MVIGPKSSYFSVLYKCPNYPSLNIDEILPFNNI